MGGHLRYLSTDTAKGATGYNYAQMNQNHTIAVLGAGQMGGGIAQLCAACGMQVGLYDAQAKQTESALQAMAKRLSRIRQKDESAAEPSDILNRIAPHAELGPWLQDADIIIEAVSEDLPVKIELYQTVEPLLSAGALLASNTSSFSISLLAAKLQKPHRFAGVHFMNPAPRMRLVEIIPGKQTAPEVVAHATEFAHALGKDTVRSADSPGFITNRILMPMINEAVCALASDIGTAEDIDRAMTLGMNHPMGPLALADFIGLDTCLAVLHVLQDGLQDDKFAPSPLLQKMVTEGRLGKKSGRGFYEYES